MSLLSWLLVILAGLSLAAMVVSITIAGGDCSYHGGGVFLERTIAFTKHPGSTVAGRIRRSCRVACRGKRDSSRTN
jgi:hypothetical protein